MISATSFDIQVLGKLDEEGPSSEGKYFIVLKVGEDKEIESGDAPRVPDPGWKGERPFQINVWSEINIEIFRRSRSHFRNPCVAKYTGQVVDLLANGVDHGCIIESADKKGPHISIKLDLDVEDRADFMKTVDEDVLRIPEVKGADGAQKATVIMGPLGIALQKIVPIIDQFAGSHPVLNAAWIVLSSAYKVVQSQIALDDAVRKLVEILREMAGQAAVCTPLEQIVGTVDIIAEIGRTSLHVAWLIHRYADPSIMGKPSMYARIAKLLFSKIPSEVEACSERCKALIGTLHERLQINMFAAAIRAENIQKKKDIPAWMCLPESFPNYDAALMKRQKETGFWVIATPEFKDWKEKPGGVLWLEGPSGCGKTVLCATSIEDIIDSSDSTPSVGYAYFFFDATSTDTEKLTSYENLIKSIIVQLADRWDGIPVALEEMYHVFTNKHRQPDLSSLEKTLLSIVDGFDEVYIVIDSLDECTERETVLKWIQSITSSNTAGKVHMMATSRPERDIEEDLRNLSSMKRMSIADYPDAKKDLARFINVRLSQVPKKKNWDEKRKQGIKKALIDRAGGMFRWVDLTFDELLKCSSEADLNEQLESLPMGLHELYSRILKRRPNAIKRFLQWVAYSKRAMTVSEIAEVALIDFEPGTSPVPVFEDKQRYLNADEVLSVCSGLLSEVEGKVKLAHFSVKEYLVSLESTGVPSKVGFQRRASECIGHSIIAQTCLAYLQHFDKPDSITAANIDSLSLAQYAADHWIDHFHSAPTDIKNNAALQELALNLFRPATRCALINWIRIRDKQFDLEMDTFAPPLWYACSFGLTETARFLIDHGADVQTEAAGYVTALVVASRNGHLETVKLLVGNGPHIDTERGEMYGVALRAASSQGHLEIVECLVKNGAHLDTEGEETVEIGWRETVCHGTALVLASLNGHLEIVKILVAKGALLDTEGRAATVNHDFSEKTEQHGTALVLASLNGHLEIAKILVANRALLDTEGRAIRYHIGNKRKQHGTALVLASLEGHLEMVKILVAKGALLDTEGGETHSEGTETEHSEATEDISLGKHNVRRAGTALVLAFLKDRLEIVQFLAANGADLNTKGEETQVMFGLNHARHRDGTALVLASFSGKLDIVKTLAENGADLNIEGEQTIKDGLLGDDESRAWHGTALVLASLRGRLDIVNILVEKGALLDIKGKWSLGGRVWHSTALDAASTAGHPKIKKLLAKAASDRTALQAAETGEVYDEPDETPKAADLAVATLSLDTYHHFLIIILLASPILLAYWIYLY